MALKTLLLHSDQVASKGADPGKQAIPSGWPTNLNGLNTQIYKFVGALLDGRFQANRRFHSYTMGIVQSFSSQGTPIDILQVSSYRLSARH